MNRDATNADLPRTRINRRALLRAGSLGLLGLSLPDFLRLEAAAAGTSRASKVKSCILLYYYGGPSHHDTWDMKPDAPPEVRGQFKPIATKVPGLRISEHLSRTAQVADKLAI